jgi:PAS domain S-box-containing protein
LSPTHSESAEQAARRLAAIVDSSEDAIISKDLNGVIATWNAAAERVYGYPASEVIGQPMTIVLPPDRSTEESDILARIRRGERVEHFETKRVRKDGTLIDVSLTISPVRDKHGQVIGASHIARDITQQKKFERHFQQSQRMEGLGVLAGGIAHDFNNLLTGIIANATLIAEMLPPSSAAQPLIADLSLTGHRLSDLTKQLLNYAGKSTFVKKPFQLSTMVREITGLIRAAISRDVDVRLELSDSLPETEGDPTQIQQVVMNLIINAAEAADKERAWVVARTYKQEFDEHAVRTLLTPDEVVPGSYVCLEVEDNGKGMDAATQLRIFDPFFTTKIKGRGLGLASVLGIVRGHGGAIKVYSEPGRGTSIRVFLPVAPATSAEEIVAAPASLKGEGTILVVDDEEIVRKIAGLTLERYSYSVLLAEDGEHGVEVFRRHKGEIAAVLLDLMMPRLGGEQAFFQLRQLDPNVKVIISSGYSDTEALSRFERLPIAGFLRKPFTSTQLAQVVKEAIASKAAVGVQIMDRV